MDKIVTDRKQTTYDRPENALTISELTAQLKRTIEDTFQNIRVVGEVSRFTRASSGHIYLTLKDEDAVLKGIIWRSRARRMDFDLEDGLEVIAEGNLDVYPPRGSYQLIIRDIEPRGMGGLELAFRQLVEKLKDEGLFRPEHKKELPEFPTRIGIVTSPTGAAVRDIVRVISRRWPPVRIYLLPRRVQGEGAAEEIAGAIRLLNNRLPDLDLMIVGRGGGSLEDLWAFNEEVVARAIFDSDIPVVSAVGHEVDVSVSDMVADLRVATPSAAGENVVPDYREVIGGLQHMGRRMVRALQNRTTAARQQLDALRRSHVLRHPERLLQDRAQKADELWNELETNFNHRLEMMREKINSLGGRLDALSPLRVMDRGYSVALDSGGDLLCSVDQVEPGDDIFTRMQDGRIRSTVRDVEVEREKFAEGAHQ
ncbi:MAG: exodeoxyribonuclease VII large subunit [Planctomycetota bacterium]